MSKKRQFHMLMGRAGPANRNGRLAAALGATALAWAGVTGFAVPGPAGALLAPRAPAASAPAGLNPQGAVVDPATHTLYVADGKGNAVSVIDTATCNAQLSMGCAKAVATVHLGPQPVVEPGQSGAFPTAIGFTTWAYALARTPAGKMGATTYLVPALTVVMSWALLGQVPGLLVIGGGVLCLAGVAIARRRPRPSVPRLG